MRCVGSIYMVAPREKTGCANRAEASAYAIRQGLAEEVFSDN
jgi:hypothetical protein